MKKKVVLFPSETIRLIKERWVDSQIEINKIMEMEMFKEIEENTIPTISVDKQQLNLLQTIQRELDNLTVHAQELVQYKPEITQEQSQDKQVTSYEQPESQEVVQHTEPMSEDNHISEIIEQIPQVDEGKSSSSDPMIEEIKDTSMPTDNTQPLSDESSNNKDTQLSDSLPIVDDITNPTSTPEITDQQPSDQENSEKVNNLALSKIKIVAEGVDTLKENIKSLFENTSKLEFIENDLSTKNLKKSRKTVEDLQKKCLLYSETLLKDLLALDEIVNTPEARPLRKQQVQSIQQLMSDVDGINLKLRNLLKVIKEKENEGMYVERKFL